MDQIETNLFFISFRVRFRTCYIKPEHKNEKNTHSMPIFQKRVKIRFGSHEIDSDLNNCLINFYIIHFWEASFKNGCVPDILYGENFNLDILILG